MMIPSRQIVNYILILILFVVGIQLRVNQIKCYPLTQRVRRGPLTLPQRILICIYLTIEYIHLDVQKCYNEIPEVYLEFFQMLTRIFSLRYIVFPMSFPQNEKKISCVKKICQQLSNSKRAGRKHFGAQSWGISHGLKSAV